MPKLSEYRTHPATKDQKHIIESASYKLCEYDCERLAHTITHEIAIGNNLVRGKVTRDTLLALIGDIVTRPMNRTVVSAHYNVVKTAFAIANYWLTFAGRDDKAAMETHLGITHNTLMDHQTEIHKVRHGEAR